MKKNYKRCYYPIAVGLLLFSIFCIRYRTLALSAHPTGLDGYYYALQAKSFAQTGKLENPDTAPGYYLCGLFAFVSRDAIIGCKVYSALASTLIALSVFTLLCSLCPTQSKKPLLGLLLCAAIPSSVQLSVNYINNQTGLYFFLFYASLIIHLLHARHQRRPTLFALAAVLLILSLLSHLITATYSLFFTAYIAYRALPKKITLPLMVGIVFSMLYVAARHYPRFAGIFSWTPTIPATSSFMRSRLDWRLIAELSLLPILCWAACIYTTIVKKRFIPYIGAAFLLYFPFWGMNSLDMGYRLFLSASPCAIVLLVHLLHNPRNRLTSLTPTYTGALLMCVAGIVTSSSIYDPQNDPPYEYYRTVANKIDIGDDSLLIAHLGMNHVYTYYHNLRMALNYVPDFPFRKEKLWRLAYGVQSTTVQHLFPEMDTFEFASLVQPIDRKYLLIREDMWNEYLRREQPDIRETRRNWYNPATPRPKFIR